MIKPEVKRVEDTEENRQICRKYCGACPTYKQNSLGQQQPDLLFCACGTSSAPAMKKAGCFCPACEIFTRNSLAIGHFCIRH